VRTIIARAVELFGKEEVNARNRHVYSSSMRIILVADDQAMFRTGLRSLLTAQGHDVVGEAKNGREAVTLARELTPDLVLMDLSMPEVDGLTATKLITTEMPEVKVVILTATENDAALFEGVRPDEQGHVIRNLEPDHFFALLDRANDGVPPVSPTLARRLLNEFAKQPDHSAAVDENALTARQREIVELMAKGVVSSRKLAKQLGVSENTIRSHMRGILDKLGLHNRAEVVGYALRKRMND
jgi:DNA-binding NarL/FixJ family response regulator